MISVLGSAARYERSSLSSTSAALPKLTTLEKRMPRTAAV